MVTGILLENVLLFSRAQVTTSKGSYYIQWFLQEWQWVLGGRVKWLCSGAYHRNIRVNICSQDRGNEVLMVDRNGVIGRDKECWCWQGRGWVWSFGG